MNKYEIIKDIGGGTFGTVYEGINKQTNQKVAIKKLKQKIDSWEDCMNQNEVYFLRKLVHPNIIKLIEVIREQNSDISFVFEYCDGNLYEYLSNHRKRKKIISEEKIQNIIYNITSGLAFMHSQNVMHRDLKPENILISLDNINMDNNAIKIADFGTAKEVPKYKNDSLTDYICTRWYRAPECVLKSKNYDEKIDIWALGCIMAELYNLKPLFPGQSAFDQINKIVYVLGTPSYEDWPEGYRLMQDLNMKFPENIKKNFRNHFYDICEEAVNFLEFIFQYDPNKRPSAKELLNHPYLKNKLNLSKIRMNSYSSQSRKDNYIPIKERMFSNSSINNQAPFNYNKMFLNENHDRNNNNNQISSPTFFIPQVKNKSINIIPSRFDEEDSFFNKKPCGRSKSSMIEQRKYNNINDNNTFNIMRDTKSRNNNYKFSDIGNENKELDEINKLLDKNIFDMQNKYDNIYSNRSKNGYMPFKNDYNTNNAFSSIAKNDIVQNNQFLFNRYIDKRKETINNMDNFHNIAPKIKRYTSNGNNYMFNDNKNIGINANPIDKYRSFFATRYNL